MISELSDATSLQNTDLIPLARGATTLKVSGLTLAGSLTSVASGSFASKTDLTSLSSTLSATFIPKPASASAQQVLTYDSSTATWVASAAPGVGSSIANLSAASYGLFRKSDPSIVAWTKTGNFTVSTSTAIYVEVNGAPFTIASGTAITMPVSPVVGTDYVIWAKPNGTLEVTSNYTTPPVANSRRVGGFHYAPGGNATAQSGGNTTAQINEYSFWDLKFRPTCPDPRGMTLIANSFWVDIYLCGVDHITNGTSKYNVTIADGSAPPKIPTLFGGNGTTAYANGNWWNFAEVLNAYGKRMVDYSEFTALAYGTTENTSSGGTDVPTTGVSGTGATTTWEKFTSKWGVIQSTGCVWSWGSDIQGSGNGWVDAGPELRGDYYASSLTAACFGGHWVDSSSSGSRCSGWSLTPTHSASSLGVRGACDHLSLD